MAPSRKDAGHDLRQCSDCVLRGLPCDGGRPSCSNCRDAGTVCPGYGMRRPLIWLPPGNVTVPRNRRAKPKTTKASVASTTKPPASTGRRPDPSPTVAAGGADPATSSLPSLSLSLPATITTTTAIATTTLSIPSPAHSVSSSSSSGSGSSNSDGSVGSLNDVASDGEIGASLADPSQRSQNGNLAIARRNQLMAAQRRRALSLLSSLRLKEWDIVDAIGYYNTHIYPSIAFNQHTQTAYNKPFNKWVPEIVPSSRHGIIAVVMGYRLCSYAKINGVDLVPTTSGPAAHLWSTFFHHVGLALTSLNDELNQEAPHNTEILFRSIHLLASAEVFVSCSPQWRAHVAGFLHLLTHYGGLGQILNLERAPKLLVLSFIVNCFIANTTSSRANQIIEIANLDSDDLCQLYSFSMYPAFICPTYIFRDMVRINKLRLPTVALVDGHSSEPSASGICEILADIDEFVPFEWIDEHKFSAPEQFLLTARIYQSAMAVYAYMTVPCTSKTHLKTSCENLGILYRGHLFRLLAAAFESQSTIDNVFWPVIVAGVAAADGTQEERDIVHRHLSLGLQATYSGVAPVKAMKIFKRFWQSGMTSWDDCFFDANLILI